MRQGFGALVVDDDDFSRMTAVHILRRLGAGHVLEAADGADALTLAETPDARIDLIVCDLCMPRFDGIETLEGLAKRRPSAAFVLASSADARLLRAAAGSTQRAGLTGLHVLDKPVTLAKIQAVFATIDAADRVVTRVSSPRDYGFSAEDLRRGLRRDEFTAHYQPKLRIADRKVSGAETLIRWRHPEHGLLPAGAFMPVAQEHDLLNEIFFVTFPTAVAQCAGWSRDGYAGDISINLPIAVLGARDLPNRLEAFVAEHRLAASRVVFELTEDGWLQEQVLAREILTRLRVRGFGLAIDDFGTGYSGLQQLLNAPFSELKIDQGFVRAAPVDADSAIALASIVALARQLGLRIVAEGVETQKEWQVVADAGCDEAQGYLIAKPLSAPEFERWLAAQPAIAAGVA